MQAFYSTTWSQLSTTTWGSWYTTAWADLGFIFTQLSGAADEYSFGSIVKKLPIEKKKSVVKIKLKFKGYSDTEIEKELNKKIKVTVEDIKFIQRQIEINNIQL